MRWVKRIGSFLLAAAAAAGIYAGVRWWQALPQEDWAIAQGLWQMDGTGDELEWVHWDGSRDEQRLFHLFDSGSPYLASLTIRYYFPGLSAMTQQWESRAKQETAVEEARKTGAQVAAQEDTIRKKLRAIHDEIVRRCVYDEGAGAAAQTSAATAIGVMEDGTAVCSGYARTFVAMCDGAGLDAISVSDEGMNHMWNAVRIADTTYFIDCTYDDPVPDRGNDVSEDYFLLTAEDLAESHTWDAAFYEQVLDSLYSEQFASIQQMQDRDLAPKTLRAADTDRIAERDEIAALETALGQTLDLPDGATCGQLYEQGYAVWREAND